MNPKTFCSTDTYRYALTEPRILDGILYATCGRVIVWGPAGAFDPFENSTDFLASTAPSNLAKTTGDILENSTGHNLALPPGWETIPQKTKPCSHCDSTGKVATCPDCDGEGSKECPECYHIEECKLCDGTGTIKGASKQCDQCEGEGKTTESTWIYARQNPSIYYPIQLPFLLKLRSADPAFELREPRATSNGVLVIFPSHPTIRAGVMTGRLEASDRLAAEQQWNPAPPAKA